MHIHIDRKKLLCVTFFLCCVLPSCLPWFAAGEDSWAGYRLMGFPMLAAVALYAFALLFDRFRHVLALGLISHGLLLAAWLNCLISFPLLTGLGQARDLSMSMAAVRPGYWVSLALGIVHAVLFATTEIAVQRLSRRKQRNA